VKSFAQAQQLPELQASSWLCMIWDRFEEDSAIHNELRFFLF